MAMTPLATTYAGLPLWLWLAALAIGGGYLMMRLFLPADMVGPGGWLYDTAPRPDPERNRTGLRFGEGDAGD
jgi:hypothetical protein